MSVALASPARPVLAGSGNAWPMTGDQIREMMRCGANWPGPNFVDPHTDQLAGFV